MAFRSTSLSSNLLSIVFTIWLPIIRVIHSKVKDLSWYSVNLFRRYGTFSVFVSCRIATHSAPYFQAPVTSQLRRFHSQSICFLYAPKPVSSVLNPFVLPAMFFLFLNAHPYSQLLSRSRFPHKWQIWNLENKNLEAFASSVVFGPNFFNSVLNSLEPMEMIVSHLYTTV